MVDPGNPNTIADGVSADPQWLAELYANHRAGLRRFLIGVVRDANLADDLVQVTFAKAATAKGVTGEALLQMLERRLDNIVFRLGFAPSRSAARQLVRHRPLPAVVQGQMVDSKGAGKLFAHVIENF